MPQRFTSLATATATVTAAAVTAATVTATAAVGAVSLALLAAAPALAHAADARTAPVSHDHLTVTVTHAGPGADGTYHLTCAPGSGPRSSPEGASRGSDHPDPAGACARLGELAAAGTDPFAPPQQRAVCTMIYGGPAVAHVSGTWQGRPVEADFRRTDGCEVTRWNSLVPVLPVVGPRTGVPGASGRGSTGSRTGGPGGDADGPAVNRTAGSSIVG